MIAPICFVAFVVAVFVWFLWELRGAPLGHQDHDSFHFDEERKDDEP